MVENPSKGVGGFLALLVAGLIVLGPLLSFGMTYGEISRTEENFPEILWKDAWSSFKAIVWISLFVQIALTVSAGISLLTKFKPNSVRFTIFVLWFSGVGLTLISMALISRIPGYDPNTGTAEFAKSLFQGTVTAGIWTTYLLLSKRVKITYYNNWGISDGMADLEPKARMSLGDRWKNLPLARRQAVFFSGCWMALVIIWATVFDEDTTYYFQDGWHLDWGKIWAWALLPPAVYFLLRWIYAKFVIAGSDKDPA